MRRASFLTKSTNKQRVRLLQELKLIFNPCGNCVFSSYGDSVYDGRWDADNDASECDNGNAYQECDLVLAAKVNDMML